MGFVLVVVSLVAFALLAASIVAAMRTRRRTARECKLVDGNGSRLQLSPPVGGGFHLFLSHQWQWGQDQAGTLKSALQVLVPELHCFLDVDSLKDISQLEAHVKESDVVLIVLTKGYLSSTNCRRELREALKQKKRLLVVREMDTNHGAVSVAELRIEAELLPLQADRHDAEELMRLVEESAVLEWHREGHLKRTTLAAVVQTVLDVQEAEGAKAQVRCSVDDQQTMGIRPTVQLLGGYRAAAPQLCAGVMEALDRAGVDMVYSKEEDKGEDNACDSALPTIILLCPELFGDKARSLRAELAVLLRQNGAMEGAVRIYSTEVPFDYYLKHCPLELRGLLRHMYDKWPESVYLQDTAARLVARQLHTPVAVSRRRAFGAKVRMAWWGVAPLLTNHLTMETPPNESDVDLSRV